MLNYTTFHLQVVIYMHMSGIYKLGIYACIFTAFDERS